MVESVKESEFRANLDEYEDRAWNWETVVIADEVGTPRLTLFCYEVFLQGIREAREIAGSSDDGLRGALNAVSADGQYSGHKVRESEFRADLDKYEDMALSEAVVITDEGDAARIVLAPYDVYVQFSRNNRRAYHISELPEASLRRILSAEVPEDDEGWPDEDSP